MTPADLKRWPKSRGLSQSEAASTLGLKRRMLQYYESGERDGRPVVIPRTVRLACFAVENGCPDFPSSTAVPDMVKKK